MTPADEAKIATFYATPAYRQIRHLVERLSPSQIEEIVEKVRREVWRDLS